MTEENEARYVYWASFVAVVIEIGAFLLKLLFFREFHPAPMWLRVVVWIGCIPWLAALADWVMVVFGCLWRPVPAERRGTVIQISPEVSYRSHLGETPGERFGSSMSDLEMRAQPQWSKLWKTTSVFVLCSTLILVLLSSIN